MRIAIVQMNPVFGNVADNIEHARSLITREQADMFVLPELCMTGYNFIDAKEVSDLAEAADGRTFREMVRLAKEKACCICYGFAENSGRLYNSAALVGPSGLLGLYRKVHLYFREKIFFTPGDLGFPVFSLPFGKVGMMICFDWIFPESARSLALGGAELILHPSNLVLPHCPDAMVTRCLENRVFSATANRVGAEDRGGISLSYIGRSEIVSPSGEILTRLDSDKAQTSVVEIDLSVARNKNLNEFNNLMGDRFPDRYRWK
jgi:predicted amidohydrolase